MKKSCTKLLSASSTQLSRLPKDSIVFYWYGKFASENAAARNARDGCFIALWRNLSSSWWKTRAPGWENDLIIRVHGIDKEIESNKDSLLRAPRARAVMTTRPARPGNAPRPFCSASNSDSAKSEIIELIENEPFIA